MSNIASAINDAHQRVEAAKVEGAKYAIECGRLLGEAKATVKHGEWDAWVKANCRFSPRTAQLYMKVAKHVGDDPAKAQRVADLSLRDVASELAVPRLPDAAQAEAHKLLALWYGSDAAAKISFAGWLLAQGDIDQPTFRRMCAAVGMTSEAAAKNVAAVLARRVPQERHAELAEAFKTAGVDAVVRAMDERNKGSAPRQDRR